MKITAIAISFCLGISSLLQTKSFEREALALAQRIPASTLDSKLPKRPFAFWFSQFVGPQAGIVWQLTACGEDVGASDDSDRDLPACAQANASLPDGRKVIVVIAVGTFKKGLTGNPVFFRAVVEHENRFYQVDELHDLPEMLRKILQSTEHMSVEMPSVVADQLPISLSAPTAYLPDLSSRSSPMPGYSNESEAPPHPSTRRRGPQKISEAVLRGNAITKVQPLYPASARKMNALGSVEVQITISEEGRVIEAVAISGHYALRRAAVTATLKWVFKPTTLQNVPVQAQSILTFVFTEGDQ
jgi:TonB family protein